MDSISIIKCMDTDDFLEVWNYAECDNTSPLEMKTQRGVIKDKEGNIVASSFGYTDEYNETEIQEVEERMGGSVLDDWVFHYSVEGTLLRMYYSNHRWYLSTHKKLDAFKSRWSCRQTFGELFASGLEDILERKSAFEWLQENLPKENVYFFLVRANAQNRVVCQTHHVKKTETVFFLGHYTEGSPFVFHVKGQSEISVLNMMEGPTPLQFQTVQELCDRVKATDPFQYQGVIAFKKNSFETFKVVSSEYQMYYKVRGNNPNLRFRYLELRNDPDQLKLLYVLYPKYALLFEDYERTLYDVARMIYHFYVQRYIKNQYVTLPREEYLLLKKCHVWYLEDRKNNRIFTQKVLEMLAEEPAIHLYKMIRRFHMEKSNPYTRMDSRPAEILCNRNRNRTFMNVHQDPPPPLV